jgi:hypothetical protein
MGRLGRLYILKVVPLKVYMRYRVVSCTRGRQFFIIFFLVVSPIQTRVKSDFNPTSIRLQPEVNVVRKGI